MVSNVSYFAAMIGGLLSFLSPCVLPLVPFYLAYLSGSTIEQLSDSDKENREAYIRVIAGSIAFVLGFTTVFVALGAGVNTAFRFILDYQQILAQIGGAVIIVFGLHFLGILKIPLLYREARFHMAQKPMGLLGAYIMGLAFAFGWTPCIGPVLSVILAMAASAKDFGTGISLLFVYSLGLGIPFILAAIAIGPFMSFMKRFRKHMGTVEKVMGALLVLAGILFLTGTIQVMGTWMLETFPALQKFG